MRPDRNQTCKSFLRFFYAYRFFNDFAFIYAVYILLFKMNGLSVFEISLLLALWCGFVILFEIPTGALADKWNRKYMLSLGMLSKADPIRSEGDDIVHQFTTAEPVGYIPGCGIRYLIENR